MSNPPDKPFVIASVIILVCTMIFVHFYGKSPTKGEYGMYYIYNTETEEYLRTFPDTASEEPEWSKNVHHARRYRSKNTALRAIRDLKNLVVIDDYGNEYSE